MASTASAAATAAFVPAKDSQGQIDQQGDEQQKQIVTRLHGVFLSGLISRRKPQSMSFFLLYPVKVEKSTDKQPAHLKNQAGDQPGQGCLIQYDSGSGFPAAQFIFNGANGGDTGSVQQGKD